MVNDLTRPTRNGSQISFEDYKNIFFNYIICFVAGLVIGVVFL